MAAVYELTPLKNVCLGKCRSPLGTLLGSWRDGWSGALRMGAKNGAWCVGCCWALMASLFALGVMSVTWMAVVAGLIAIEKILPWRRTATYGTALVLLALGVLVLFAPDALPGLTVPGARLHARDGVTNDITVGTAQLTAQPTRMTCNERGPCTPSTRSSSMSLVADGPLIQVCGRTGSSSATASGTSGTTWSARTTHT